MKQLTFANQFERKSTKLPSVNEVAKEIIATQNVEVLKTTKYQLRKISKRKHIRTKFISQLQNELARKGIIMVFSTRFPERIYLINEIRAS